MVRGDSRGRRGEEGEGTAEGDMGKGTEGERETDSVERYNIPNDAVMERDEGQEERRGSNTEI